MLLKLLVRRIPDIKIVLFSQVTWRFSLPGPISPLLVVAENFFQFNDENVFVDYDQMTHRLNRDEGERNRSMITMMMIMMMTTSQNPSHVYFINRNCLTFDIQVKCARSYFKIENSSIITLLSENQINMKGNDVYRIFLCNLSKFANWPHSSILCLQRRLNFEARSIYIHKLHLIISSHNMMLLQRKSIKKKKKSDCESFTITWRTAINGNKLPLKKIVN